MSRPAHEGLQRSLGLWDAVSVGMGAIVGAGIFVVTGEAAGVAGPAFLIGLLIAGVVAAFNGISSAQLAAVYPYSGGTYEYGYHLLNPAMGFSAGWMFVVSKLSAAGVVALGFGAYFNMLLPAIPAVVWSVGAVVLLTLANCFGIRKAGAVNMVIVSITLLALLYFVAGASMHFDAANLRPFAPMGWLGVAESSALLFFAFTGYARIATLAEEVTDPKRTIPRAVIITLLAAILLYGSVALVTVGSMGAPAMAATNAPLQLAAEGIEMPLITLVIMIGASTAMLGVLLSQILGISRMMLAMGRRHDLPRALATVHAGQGIPLKGILLTGAIVLVMTLVGSLELVLRAATFSILLYYTITNLSALKQPAQEQLYGRWIPVLGLIGCLLMALSLPWVTILSGIGILFFGHLLRFLLHRSGGGAPASPSENN